MAYFHLGDLNPVISGVLSKENYECYFGEPGTMKARYLRYIKTNLGVKGSPKKLFKLMERMRFSNVADADSQIDWSKVPIVNL